VEQEVVPKKPKLGLGPSRDLVGELPGMIDAPTDELLKRAKRTNPDVATTSHPISPTGYSNTRSFSIGDERGQLLIPQVVDGFLLTPKDAIRHALRTNKHLGRYNTIDDAEKSAKQIHEAQELHEFMFGRRKR
jgi:hypothetical protein